MTLNAVRGSCDLLRTPFDGRIMSLGKLTSISTYFAEAKSNDRVRRFSVDKYTTPFLRQAVDRQQADPISRWTRFWNCFLTLSAARNLATFAAVSSVSVVSACRALIAEIEVAMCAASCADDGKVDIRLCDLADELLGRASAAAASAMAGSAGGKLEAPGAHRMVFNDQSLARRIVLPQLPGSWQGGAIYAEESGEEESVVIVDVPQCGFSHLEAVDGTKESSQSIRTTSADGVTLAIAEEGCCVLRTEFFEARIDRRTGALASLHDFLSRGNRISQRLVSRQGQTETIEMVADDVSIASDGTACARIISVGRLLATDGDVVAQFQLQYSTFKGSRELDVKLKLTDVRPLQASPWSDYLAVRTAWSSDLTRVCRCVNEQVSVTELSRFESPLFVELEDGQRRTSLLTAGLPYHRRSGDRALDTLLCVHGETAREFSYGIGVDLRSPLQTVMGRASPTAMVECVGRRVSDGGTGWLFHADSPHAVLGNWRPVWPDDDGELNESPLGVRFTVTEVSGRAGIVTIRAFRNVIEAGIIDIDAVKHAECEVVDGTIRLSLEANEWTEVEARW